MQAATYIITILTAPPSTKTPSLEAETLVRNALQNISETFNRVKKLPNPPTPSPRVEAPSKVPTTVPIATPTDNATLPRVQAHSTWYKSIIYPTPLPNPIINYKDKCKRGM